MPVGMLEPDGVQQFLLNGGGEETVVLPLLKPWYLDAKSWTVGPLELDIPPHLLRVLQRTPTVPPPLAARFSREMEHEFLGHDTLLPRAFCTTRYARM